MVKLKYKDRNPWDPVRAHTLEFRPLLFRMIDSKPPARKKRSSFCWGLVLLKGNRGRCIVC